MDTPTSTLHDIESGCEDRGATWVRRSFLLLLTVFVAAGLLGVLGVRTTVVRDEGSGFDLALRYASTARAGSDVPWEVTLTHAGGFDGDVTLAVTGDYFDIYETQGFHPAPAEETRDGHILYLTFTAPAGDTLVVAYDAYIQPASQVGRGGVLSVLDQGAVAASVDFDTFLLP